MDSKRKALSTQTEVNIRSSGMTPTKSSPLKAFTTSMKKKDSRRNFDIFTNVSANKSVMRLIQKEDEKESSLRAVIENNVNKII